jgi:hypothetical protein
MTTGQRLEHRYWLSVLRDAEHELDAAQRLSDVNYAARLLMNAKCELSRLGVDWRQYLPAAASPSNS